MSEETPSRTVVSCIVERSPREVLICRPADEADGRQPWEFPAGLKEPGESHEAAMRRVCRNRVGLAVRIHAGQPPFVAEYEGRLATFRFFQATVRQGQARTLDYADVRWVNKGQLCEYLFGKAFEPVVAWLTE